MFFGGCGLGSPNKSGVWIGGNGLGFHERPGLVRGLLSGVGGAGGEAWESVEKQGEKEF